MTRFRPAALGLGIALCGAWGVLAAGSVTAGGTSAAHLSRSSDVRSSPAGTTPGERFYRTGIGPGGNAVAVTVQGDLRLRSTDMPCVNCHRRSGWGTTEGPVTAPPIVGRVLFSPVTLGNPQMGVRTTGPGTRPAYDAPALLRALRDGIDPAGRPLSGTMPRYTVTEGDAASLGTYLGTLNGTPPPGVTDSTLHLATITSPDSDQRRQQAMLGVLREFVTVKNADTRHETRRRERGPWDMKSQYDLYRHWELHEWVVKGDPRTWPAQLEAQYAKQPVFAVVGGLADGDWTPIHTFCERNDLPCVFPLTATPPEQGVDDDFYSIYFSRGVTLEADALAHYLKDAGAARAARTTLQVARCGSEEARASRLLAEQLGPAAMSFQCVAQTEALTAAAWQTILRARPGALVAWLPPADLVGLGELAARPHALDGVSQVYLSASLLGDAVATMAPALRERAFLVDPFVPPDEFESHAARSLVWLKSRSLTTADRLVSVNAFFGITAVADAVGTPRALGSREYFVELVEHMVGRSPQRSAYPTLSLSAQRRFASLGCYVLKIPADPGGTFRKVGAWFVPERRDVKEK